MYFPAEGVICPPPSIIKVSVNVAAEGEVVVPAGDGVVGGMLVWLVVGDGLPEEQPTEIKARVTIKMEATRKDFFKTVSCG